MRSRLMLLTAWMVVGCGQVSNEPSFTQAEAMDPQKCQACHPDHATEWSGSMHAYASDDPVFVAMNARAQRETQGSVGSFCVKCHAPMAVATGATTDGLNLASLPTHLRGVTCYFCHSVEAVTGTHDAPIQLAHDGVLRAAIADPVDNEAHRSGDSPWHRRTDARSAALCGSCHDVVNQHGVPLERTYQEWQSSLYSHEGQGLTCGQCHMEGRDGVAAQVSGAVPRRVHSHLFAGVDTPLTPWPQADVQRSAVQASLDTTLQAALCVKGAGGAATLQVVLDNVGAGHHWPSGAAQDRRAWVEVKAYAAGQVIYQSGAVEEGASVMDGIDPDRWLLRDCLLDAKDNEVHMFWEAVSHESNQLPAAVTRLQTDPAYYLTHVARIFPRPTSKPAYITPMPERVTLRVRLVPIGLDVLDDLVKSGDLDPGVKAAMPFYTLGGSVLEWTAQGATIKYVDEGQPVLCVTKGLSAGANTTTPASERTRCAP